MLGPGNHLTTLMRCLRLSSSVSQGMTAAGTASMRTFSRCPATSGPTILNKCAPLLMSANQIRRASSTRNTNMSKIETEVSHDQFVMRDELELRNETVNNINNKIETDPGRLFAVIHMRGIQHKVTAGKKIILDYCILTKQLGKIYPIKAK